MLIDQFFREVVDKFQMFFVVFLFHGSWCIWSYLLYLRLPFRSNYIYRCIIILSLKHQWFLLIIYLRWLMYDDCWFFLVNQAWSFGLLWRIKKWNLGFLLNLWLDESFLDLYIIRFLFLYLFIYNLLDVIGISLRSMDAFIFEGLSLVFWWYLRLVISLIHLSWRFLLNSNFRF